MSSLRFFIELLTGWNFFGQNQLVIKEQLLVNCMAIRPTWDKAISKLSVQTARTDNSEDLGLVCTTFTTKDQILNLAQVTLLKPSFSRSKRVGDNKTRSSSEQSDADSSNKLSETGLPKPSHRSSPKASHANPINSSSAILLNQVIQASEYPKRKHTEFLESSGKGETGKEHQKDCCGSKDYITDVPQDTKSMLDIHKDVLSTKIIQTKSKSTVGKDQINASTKSKRKPAVVKHELTKKVIDHQNDVTAKVAKAKTVLAKDELTSTTKTKAKPDVNKNEATEKVIDHHKRGELRLLTVAELKCFLSAKQAKVGGSKEVLIQRATELLS